MNRIFLSTALIALLALNGCGGSKDGDGDNSSGNNMSASMETASTLDANLQAEICFQVDAKSLMQVPFFKSAIDGQKDAPSWSKSIRYASGYVGLPEKFDPATFESSINFYAKLDFEDEASAKAAFEDMAKGKKLEDVEKNGKTYKVGSDPNGPKLYGIQEGSSFILQTEAYVGTEHFATDNLRGIMNAMPKSEFARVGLDMAGAKGFFKGLAATAPQDNAQVTSAIETAMRLDAVSMSGGIENDLFTMAFEGEDEDAAKKVKSLLQKYLGMAAMATMFVDEKEMPGVSEMLSHIVDCLKPDHTGTTTKVVITKPDNFDELTKKIESEIPKIQEKVGGMMMGGMGGGQPGPPK